MKNWIIGTLLLLSACNGFKVDQLLKKDSPYETYLHSLESSPLKQFAVVNDWKLVGVEVLNDSILISLPYHEISYFDPNTPKALFLQYAVNEGSEIDISLDAMTHPESSFFLDVFEQETENKSLKRIHSADSTAQVNYQVKKSGIHAVRVQPELFRGGVIALNIENRGTLAFPITGKSSKNIASFWGDPRDANARKHEGIDVFAPRGTPVLAASDGRIRRAGTNRLGGNVVWLHNAKMGYSQYYAHLDSHAVSAGQSVKKGDTIGFVGNTGNAITTAPHLHFGIYRAGIGRRGAVDPLPFVQEALKVTKLPLSDSLKIGNHGIITASVANVRVQPNISSPILGSFPRNTFLHIEGKTGDWFRISLPDNQKGFVYENLAQIAEAPIQETAIKPTDQLRENWLQQNRMISGEIISGSGKVWGIYENESYIETDSGIRGWAALE